MNYQTINASSALNNLIEACRDGFFAYQEADGQIASAELQGYFNLVSQERLRFGQELLLEVFKTDADLGSCGLKTAERPLPWRVVKGHFNGQNDSFILTELKRLEAWTASLYHQARLAELGPELQPLLERQAFECERVGLLVLRHHAALTKTISAKSAQAAP